MSALHKHHEACEGALVGVWDSVLRDRGELKYIIHRCLLWLEDGVLSLPLFENFKVVAVGNGGGTGRTTVSGYPTHSCAFYESMVCAIIHTDKEWLS